jgi:ABC-type transport system substrate-binding protein
MSQKPAVFPRRLALRETLLAYLGSLALACAAVPQTGNPGADTLVVPGEAGARGGRVVISLRAEPKTLNPATAVDAPSREVIGAMQADLIHINRATQLTEPALAKSWKKLYDRVQQILADHQPMIFLASPNILTGAKNSIGNFHPAVLESYVLWNVDQLYVRNEPTSAGR